LEVYLDTILKNTNQFEICQLKDFIIRYQLKRQTFQKVLSFEGWWCGPFALGLIFPPPLGINRKKRSLLIALFTFPPIGTSKYE
jgi:hypothetical protein